jgi:phosphatidylinositol glycan class B
MTAAGDVDEHARAQFWTGIHLVALAALSVRLFVACWSMRITYPDELFQYLEQAHRLVYGYGIVPWEYRLAARNWLLPGTLAVLLEALRGIGLDRPTAYIPALKSVLAVASLCLVYASYSLGRNIFDERTGRLAAVLTAIWYELLYVSTVATPEVLSAYALVGALALITGRASTRRAVVIGLLLGAGIALRLQYAVPAIALWALVVIKWSWRCAVFAALAAAVVVGFAGLLDAWSWGTAFISYYNNLDLNLLLGKGDVFGSSPLFAYLFWLTVGSLGVHLLAIGYGVVQWRRSWPVLLLLTCVLVPHSLIAHKEYRFVILAVPLLLVLLAAAVVDGSRRLRPKIRDLTIVGTAIALVAALSAMECLRHGIFARNDRLVATLELSRRADVAAVLDLTGHWADSGGFYFLHHDVPFYFQQQIHAVPMSAVRSLVSHVLVPVTQGSIPGFRESMRYRTVAILEQVAPPQHYRRLAEDGRKPDQVGLEDRLDPGSKPH